MLFLQLFGLNGVKMCAEKNNLVSLPLTELMSLSGEVSGGWENIIIQIRNSSERSLIECRLTNSASLRKENSEPKLEVFSVQAAWN
jgi:hypothetical protein